MNRPKKRPDYVGTMREMDVGGVLTLSGKHGQANTFHVAAYRLKLREGKEYRVLNKKGQKKIVIIRMK